MSISAAVPVEKPSKQKHAVPQTANILWREALFCFLLFFSVFLLTTNGHDNDEEADYSYRVAQQILQHHRLGFEQPQTGVFKAGPDGRYYESYEIGNTLFLVPMAAGNDALRSVLAAHLGDAKALYVWRFMYSVWSALYCAAALVCLFCLLRTVFSQSPRRAFTAIALFCFCSYFWNFSRNLGDPVLCCLLLCTGTMALFQYGRTQATKYLVAAFTVFGFALITRLTMLLPVAAAFVYVTMVCRAQRTRVLRVWLVATLALAPFVVWQMYYNHLRTGNVLISPLQAFYASDNGLTGNLLQHVPALLFSPAKGLFVYAPPVLLSVFCFPAFWRRYRLEATYIALVGFAWLLFHAKLANNWYGAWGWGPRHFITVAPLLSLPFMVVWPEVFATRGRKVLAGLYLISGFALAFAAEVGDWLYRLGIQRQNGHSSDDVWNVRNSQSVDMLVSAAHNLLRPLTHAPFEILQGASPMNQRASNTVNVWLLTAYSQGVPAVVVVCAGFLLAAGALVSAWILLSRRSPLAQTTQSTST